MDCMGDVGRNLHTNVIFQPGKYQMEQVDTLRGVLYLKFVPTIWVVQGISGNTKNENIEKQVVDQPAEKNTVGIVASFITSSQL